MLQPFAMSLDNVAAYNAAPTLSQAAVAYASSGFAIFPVEPRGKKPLTMRGVYRATTDCDLIRQWWERWPDANIGLPCHQWVVIDVDPRHGGAASLKALQRETRLEFDTRTQITGSGGRHLVFRRPDEDARLRNVTHFLGLPGLDIRTVGGYIVGAPSIHHTGGVYQWQNGRALLPFPIALLRRWRRYNASKRPIATNVMRVDFRQRTNHQHGGRAPHCGKSQCYLDYATTQASVGRRNTFALYLAYRLVDDAGVSAEQALGWLHDYVQLIPQPCAESYTMREAERALTWAVRQCRAA